MLSEYIGMNKVTINDGIYSCEVSYICGKATKIWLKLARDNVWTAPTPDFTSIKGVTQYTHIDLSGAFTKNRGIVEIDFTNWTHKSIISMGSAFYECISLKTIRGLETLDLSDCRNFSLMCYNCRELRDIDLSNTRINRSADTEKAFENCRSLTTAVISSRTPRFHFPLETTRVDIDAGVNRMFMERINALESQLSKETKKNAVMSQEIEELRLLVGTLMARLDAANL
jgi:hypothetical protein